MTNPASSPRTLRIGTRGSPLALVQARGVATSLAELSGCALKGEIVTFTTTGDQLTNERLIDAGGKGLFTKEIDIAVDEGRVDLAVHSMKDVPIELPPGQEFVAFPPREDPREAFICKTCDHPRDLPQGATLGTASIRREAQTRRLRPDLKLVSFRGNVQTRLRKLEEGEADATYLAMAGLKRLGLEHLGTPIPMRDMLSSCCQGIVGIVAKTGTLDDETLAVLAKLDDAATRRAAITERAFLASLDGSCRTPIAGHLFEREDRWTLRGEVLMPDGSMCWTGEASLEPGADEAALVALGQKVGAQIRSDAGGLLPAFESP